MWNVPIHLNVKIKVFIYMASNPKQLRMSDDDVIFCPRIQKRSGNSKEIDFNISTCDFGKIAKGNSLVDKTLLIRAIFEAKHEMILITAPGRFGKSTNMNMLKKFIEIQVDEQGRCNQFKNGSLNYQIFQMNNLLIFQDEYFFHTHFATYPVIYANFKIACGDTFGEVLKNFKTVLRNTYLEHRHLLQSKIWSETELDINTFKKYFNNNNNQHYSSIGKDDIENGLKFLSECLFHHFNEKPVFVLIDEFDAPLNSTMFKKEVDTGRVNDLLTTIFSNLLEENRFVERALLTGVSYFATVSLSGINNIAKYMFLDNHPFVEYYGLIEAEVNFLFSQFGINREKGKVIKEYYKGYNSKGNVTLYSLWSVLYYIQTKEIKSYWPTSRLVCGLGAALRIPSIQLAIERILKDNYPKISTILERISIAEVLKLKEIALCPTDKDIRDPDLFLNFLLHQGYLTCNNWHQIQTNLVVPNNEIRHELTQELDIYYGKSTNRRLDQCATAFEQISASDTNSFQKFVDEFQAVINATSNDIIKNNEGIFYSLLLATIGRSKFQVCNDVKVSGIRRQADIVLVKDNSGYIIEMKFNQDSKKCLEQIIEKKYYKAFYTDVFEELENKLYLVINVSEDLCVSLAVLINTLDIDNVEYFPR